MATGLSDWIRTANRRRIQRHRLTKPLIVTPLGFRFSGLDQMLGLEWEAAERALIQSLFGQVDLFVNVGAHYGFYVCLAQQAGVATIALEPVAANCAMIAKHLAANGWGADVTVLPVAAGPQGGFIEIQGGGSGGTAVKALSMAPASQVQTVPMVRLDDVVSPRGRKMLVLMDVEGFELPALHGATALLSASPKPVWIIEVISHFGRADAPRLNPDYVETFALMQAAGYDAYRIDVGLVRVSLADAKAVAAKPARDGLINFLFVEAGLSPASLGLTINALGAGA